MRRWMILWLLMIVAKPGERTADLPAGVLEDKIRGGLLGQIVGNLNEPRRELLPGVEKELAGSGTDRARAAYFAPCLGEAESLRRERLEECTAAIGELKKFPKVLRQIYDAPQPQGARLQAAARAEGLEKPEKPK